MKIFDEDFEYAVKIRRLLHQYPETGFDLYKTVEIVKKELDEIGIETTSEYAKCSLVGCVGKGEKTIALRADMDALPIEENTGLAFSSKNKGKMHACGHDAHTANLLCVARILKRHENELPCRVKLLFQPSEECEISGAKEMVDNGVLDDVDMVVGTHCDNKMEVNTVGICAGDYMAGCCPITLVFNGKSVHAAFFEQGVDALQMAINSFLLMKEKVKELGKDKKYIFSMGVINGGTAHNVIASKCIVKITFRWYDFDFASNVRKDCVEILNKVAKEFGGSVDIDWEMSAPPVKNDIYFSKVFQETVSDSGIKFKTLVSRMDSEDFSWFLRERRGIYYRFGTGNEKKNCTAVAHTNTFNIDEDGMKDSIATLLSIVQNADKFLG